MLSDGYYSGIIRGNLIFLVSYSLTVLSPSALINDTHWRICYFIIWFPTQQTSCQGCKMLPADWLPVTRLSWMKKKAFQLIRKKKLYQPESGISQQSIFSINPWISCRSIVYSFHVFWLFLVCTNQIWQYWPSCQMQASLVSVMISTVPPSWQAFIDNSISLS